MLFTMKYTPLFIEFTGILKIISFYTGIKVAELSNFATNENHTSSLTGVTYIFHKGWVDFTWNSPDACWEIVQLGELEEENLEYYNLHMHPLCYRCKFNLHFKQFKFLLGKFSNLINLLKLFISSTWVDFSQNSPYACRRK